MTYGDTLLQDVRRKLNVISLCVSDSTAPRSARIHIDGDRDPGVCMYDEHSINTWQKSLEPSQIILEFD